MNVWNNLQERYHIQDGTKVSEDAFSFDFT